MLRRGLLVVLAFTLIGCGSTDGADECSAAAFGECETPDGGSVSSSIIVDVRWLQEHAGDAAVQLIDTRGSAYESERIPGAIHLRPGDLATTIDGISSQIRPIDEAQPILRAAGLRADAIAVVYGAPPEYDSSRVVWSLRYYGHRNVRYLDGGYEAWIDAGGVVETGAPSVSRSDYTITGVDEGLRVTGQWVLEQLGDAPYDMPAIGLIDARSTGEYESGRIPTSLGINWSRNLRDGLLLPGGELESLYQDLDPDVTTVTYCVTGWRGSFSWLVLTALGYEDVRLYDGSWSEWGGGAFPVER